MAFWVGLYRQPEVNSTRMMPSAAHETLKQARITGCPQGSGSGISTGYSAVAIDGVLSLSGTLIDTRNENAMMLHVPLADLRYSQRYKARIKSSC
jgi:hypothetical protein